MRSNLISILVWNNRLTLDVWFGSFHAEGETATRAMSIRKRDRFLFGRLPPLLHHSRRGAAAIPWNHLRQLPPPLPPPRLSLTNPVLCKLETCRPDLTRFNQIHAHVVATGLFRDVFAASQLVRFLTCRFHPPDTRLAALLFDQIRHPDVYTYNLLLQAFSRSSTPRRSLHFYKDLLFRRLHPNEYTLCFLLACCSRGLALWEGRQAHGHLCKWGLDTGIYANTSLVHMYGECGAHGLALQMFEEMPLRSEVSWGAMIGAHITCGRLGDALKVFGEMIRVAVEPTNSTLVSTISACAMFGDLALGRMVHGYIAVKGFELNVTLGTSLVDMYSKCGAIELAAKVFSMMPALSVGSWNCMINGLAMNGDATAAVGLFREMQRLNVQPNGVTLLAVLGACRHAGLVATGAKYFSLMRRRYGLVPNLKHYGCMVDLYGRAGRIQEVFDVVRMMPMEPDGVIWGALFGACRTQGRAVLGEHAWAQLVKILPHDASGYLFLSDVYASSRRWDEVVGVRKMMTEMNMRKVPGYSLITK